VRENRTPGSVGGQPGNRLSYPDARRAKTKEQLFRNLCSFHYGFWGLCQGTTLTADIVSFETTLDQDGGTAKDGIQLRVAAVGILLARGGAVS